MLDKKTVSLLRVWKFMDRRYKNSERMRENNDLDAQAESQSPMEVCWTGIKLAFAGKFQSNAINISNYLDKSKHFAS